MMLTIDSARSTLDQIAGDVTDYYASALAQHGATPRGVDWSCKPTQELRFVQLLRLCSFRVALSLNDVGCGYGALRGFLHTRHRLAKIDYLGVDLSEAMVDSARSRWGHVPQTNAYGRLLSCQRAIQCSAASLRCRLGTVGGAHFAKPAHIKPTRFCSKFSCPCTTRRGESTSAISTRN
jgi:SAM-dependent methyltransferase